MQVALLLQTLHVAHTRCSPGVDATIDVDHCGVVLAKEATCAAVEAFVELQLTELGGQHHTVHVVVSRLAGEPLAERSCGIAVVAQLAHRLHVERQVGRLLGEVVGFAILDEVVEELAVGSRGQCHLVDGCAPLPDGKRILQYAEVEDLVDGSAERVALFLAVVAEERDERGTPLEHLALEILEALAVGSRSHLMGEEWLVASVLECFVERSHIGHRHIDIVGIVSAIEHRGLSTLADARCRPAALVEVMEQHVDAMQVGQRVLHGKVVPVAGVGHGLTEVAVFHGDDIGIEQPRELILIARAQRIMSVVALGDEDGGTVEAHVAHHHALAELTLLRLSRHHVLSDHHHIFLLIIVALQCLHVAHALQRLQARQQLVLGMGTQAGQQPKEEQEGMV